MRSTVVYTCPKCGSSNVTKCGVVFRKTDRKWLRCVHCKDCGRKSRVDIAREDWKRIKHRFSFEQTERWIRRRTALEDTKKLREALSQEIKRVFGHKGLAILEEWIDDLVVFFRYGKLHALNAYPRKNRERLWKLVEVLKKM